MGEYRGVYLECGEGWDNIVKPLVDFVLDNGGTVMQVKQKFGGLRFYYSPPYPFNLGSQWDEFERRVAEDEEASFHTCEVTGKPGRLRSNGHWLRTLCDEEAERLEFRGTIDGRMFH